MRFVYSDVLHKTLHGRLNLVFLLSLLLFPLLTACGEEASTTTPPQAPVIASIEITPSSPAIDINTKQQFGAVARDREGNKIPEATFLWSSDKPLIVKIDDTGLASGLSEGSALITAGSNGVEGSATLTVNPTEATAPPPVPPFAAPVRQVTGLTPIAVVAQDIDGDSFPDAVVVNFDSSSLIVYYGDAAGKLTGTNLLTTGVQPVAVVAGDFGGDAAIDLISVNIGDPTLTVPQGPTISIFIQTSERNFTASTLPLTRGVGLLDPFPFDMVSGDFNLDGMNDLAITDIGNALVLVLPGTGFAAFGTPIETAINGTPAAVIAGDLNGTGAADLALLSPSNDTILVLTSSNNNDGTFEISYTKTIAGSQPAAMALADINDDGKTDLMVVNKRTTDLSVFLGKGKGTFQDPQTISLTPASQPVAIGSGDFDQDGKIDLAIVNKALNTVSLLTGDGAGTFSDSTHDQTTRLSPSSITVSDLDGNGLSDLLVTNSGDNSLSVFLNNN